MKKYILSILSLLFLNTVYSQVLYDENFDNYTLGNLGTDPNGVIPGQGNWLTIGGTTISKDNNLFNITNEPGRGKVLTIFSASPPLQNSMFLTATKTNLDSLIDHRTPGNNVIKFEIDYYMEGKQQYKGAHAWILLTHNFNSVPLVRWLLMADDGNVTAYYHNGKQQEGIKVSNNPQGSFLPFNTWVKFIVYLDYTNKKVYFETPYFNAVTVGDFLSQSTSTDLMQDYKPSELSLFINTHSANITSQMVNKYDNIKITALNAVPPHILSVTNVLAEQFNLYPNPATDRVNITNNENYLVNQVVIYDVTGKHLSTQTFNNESEIQLNVEDLASGVYLLHIQTNEGTAVKKLVKK